jgi:phage replication-related protein YjqB (UPF0714/DUF867 family)
MATYDVSVKMALSSSQQDLIKRKEHCSADPEKLATVGRALGHQVRIKRNDSEYGLYTASEVRQENPDDIVRMGEAGRERLCTSDEFAGTLDSQVPHPSCTDAEAKAKGEFVERLSDDGINRGLIVIAPHGGDIERHTDEQAECVASQLADKGVSSWWCKGWKPGGRAFAAFHITSDDIHEASFPLLDSIIARCFTYAVAFHGYSPEPSQPDVLVGGTSLLREEIVMAIKDAVAGSDITVELSDPIRDKDFNGDSLLNIVNRLTAGGRNGIQIEQSLRARSSCGQATADAVATVYNPKL